MVSLCDVLREILRDIGEKYPAWTDADRKLMDAITEWLRVNAS